MTEIQRIRMLLWMSRVFTVLLLVMIVGSAIAGRGDQIIVGGVISLVLLLSLQTILTAAETTHRDR